MIRAGGGREGYVKGKEGKGGKDARKGREGCKEGERMIQGRGRKDIREG